MRTDPIRVWRQSKKKTIHGSFTHLCMERGVRRSVVVSVVCRTKRARGVCVSVSSAAHARARHVDDEGTYVRIKRRISYVRLTTRRNQISLRTQRECRHSH